MKQEWKDIKAQIRNLEEPLSDSAWKKMNNKLGGGYRNKRLWGFLIILLFIELLAGWKGGTTSNLEKQNITTFEQVEITESKAGLANIDSIQPIESNDTIVPTSDQSLNYQPKEASISYSSLQAQKNNQSTDNQYEKSEKESGDKLNLSEGLTFLSKKPLSNFEDQEEQLKLKYVLKEVYDANKTRALFKKEKTSGFEIRAYLGSTYDLPSVSFNGEGEQKTHKNYKNYSESSLNAGNGIDAGIELKYDIKGYLKIGGGLGFREIVTRNAYDIQIKEIPVIDSARGSIVAYIPTNNGIKVSQNSSNRFRYISVPLSLYKEFPLSSKWSFTTELIHHFSILIEQNSNELDTKTLEILSSNNQSFRPFVVSGQLRLGIQYRVSSCLSLALEPSFRAYYTNLYQDHQNITWKPRDVSLNLSAIVQLKKSY